MDNELNRVRHDLDIENYEKETKKKALYKREGQEYETKGFKKWKINRKREEKFVEEKLIRFNRCDIEHRDKSICQIEYREDYVIEEIVLDGSFELINKTIDYEAGKRELFSFIFNGREYYTMPVQYIIRELDPYLYKGNTGKDILKKVIVESSKKVKLMKGKYILGFDNGWNLPQIENTDSIIILYTDTQKKIYERAKKITKNYTIEEKKEIKKKLKRLIEITKMDKTKLAIIIGWNMSAPFRLAFIEYYNLFPHLYPYGERMTGKSIIGSFFTVHFYKLYDKHLASYNLESPARLEDHLSTSTFPINIQEVHKIKNLSVLPILLDHATGTSNFERKRDAVRNEYCKPKTAGLCMDSNVLIKRFMHTAYNTKIIALKFEKNEVIIPDPEWKRLYRELKREKLFSFMFDLTKEWTNETIFNRLEKIEKNCRGVFELLEYDKNYPRMSAIYPIIRFGIDLFEEMFDIQLCKENVLDMLLVSRSNISTNLISSFHSFCLRAKDFELDREEEYQGKDSSYFRTIRGHNPKWLTTPLFNTTSDDWCFTSDNLRDFREFNKDFNSTLTNLYDFLRDGFDNKDLFELGRPYYYDMNKTKQRARGIIIDKTFLETDVFNRKQIKDMDIDDILFKEEKDGL